MKLDIMTLMAASASASSSPLAGDAAALSAGGSEGDRNDAASGDFISILQSLMAVPVDEAEGPAGSAKGLGADQRGALALLASGAASENREAANPEALPGRSELWLSGEPLPPGGNTLPGTDGAAVLDGAAQALLAPLPASLSTEGPAGASAPLARAAPGTLAAGPEGRPTGWYTQAALTTLAAGETQPTVASGRAAGPVGADAPSVRTDPSAALQNTGLQSTDLEPADAQRLESGQRSPADKAGLANAVARGEVMLSALRADAGADTPRLGGIEGGPGTLANAGPASPARVDTATPVLPLQRAGWERALTEQITVMAGRGVETAELKLDPPSLGTVHVKLTLQGDQAQLLVQSANGVVRDLMESALPRLREMLSAEGLSIDNAQVTDREQSQREAREQRSAVQDEDGRTAAEETRADRDATAPSDAELTPGGGRLHIRV